MNIVLSAAAEKDLAALFSYIRDALINPIAANNTAAQILRTIAKLSDFPELGVELKRVDYRFSAHRYLVAGSYIVIYKVSDLEIQIGRILYARSNYISLLGE